MIASAPGSVKKEDDLSASQRSGVMSSTQPVQRPRSRPSDKHPVKRGNSSSSNQPQKQPTTEFREQDAAANAKPIIDSSDDDENAEEEYEP